MPHVVVTRGGQITLTREIRKKLGVRAGDVVVVNVLGDVALVSKRNPDLLYTHDFLPAGFAKTLEQMRRIPLDARLRRLGITE